MYNQLGNPVVYWFLRSLLLVILIFSGWLITYKDKKSRNFWLFSIPAIISYSLIQGLRWKRGPDYLHYYQDLRGHLFADYKEPVYLFWAKFFSSTGLAPSFAFVLYSLLLIVSLCCVIKKFPRCAIWAFPLFIIITGSSSENIIRQYLAIPFVMFAYAAYLENRRIWMLVYMMMVPLIHYSGLFAIAVLGVIVFFSMYIDRDITQMSIYYNNTNLQYYPRPPLESRKPNGKKQWLSQSNGIFLLLTYVFLYFFWDISNFSIFSKWLSSFSFDEGTLGFSYLNDSDRWFSEEGSISQVLGVKLRVQSLLYKTSLFLSNVIIIWFGYKTTCILPRVRVMFWFTYFAIIIKTIGSDIEMYSRLYNWLVFFTPVLLGIIIMQYRFKQRWMRMLVIAICLIYYGYYGFLGQLGSSGLFGCAFIWDK